MGKGKKRPLNDTANDPQENMEEEDPQPRRRVVTRSRAKAKAEKVKANQPALSTAPVATPACSSLDQNWQNGKAVLWAPDSVDDDFQAYQNKKDDGGKTARPKENWFKGYENGLKGRLADSQAELFLAGLGYTKLSDKGALTPYTAPARGCGIDGIWQSGNQISIVEYKYNTSQLSMTQNSGMQMSTTWCDANLRKQPRSVTEKVEEQGYDRFIVHIDEDGACTVRDLPDDIDDQPKKKPRTSNKKK